MKELTIEEKAARYDEAIEVAKKYHNGILEDVMELIFPELLELEDERIRKELIDFLKEEEAKADITSKRSETLCKYIVWLEKQGEQKSIKASYTTIVETGNGGINAVVKRDLSVDKVEPKFKNGQWIVWQDKCYKVNYNGCGYELVDQNGFSTSLEYGTIDENAHLWDITKDAKDGDVIVCGVYNRPFIFKGLLDPNHPNCPVAYGGIADGYFHVSSGNCWWTDDKNYIQPATKKQRDILIIEMADAGYTFDFEEKKLKELKKHL